MSIMDSATENLGESQRTRDGRGTQVGYSQGP